MISIIFTAIFIIGQYKMADGQSQTPTINDSVLLRESVFDEYLPIMPLCSQGPLEVSMDLFLYMVVHFDEVEEVIDLNGWFNMHWMDCKLRWNASYYNGLSHTEFPYTSNLWIPDITWLQRIPYIQAYEYQRGIFTGARGYPSDDGSISISRQLLFKSYCSLDLTVFPFDTQKCSLTFMSWIHPASELVLYSSSGIGNISFTVPTGSWNVLGMPVHTGYFISESGENFTSLTYELIVERMSAFYVFYLLLPAIFISMLTCFVFFLPPQSQEKLGFILSIVVTISVMMLTMTDLTPHNAQIPIISVYFFTVFAVSSLSATITVLLELIYEHYPKCEVPGVFRFVFIDLFGKIGFFRPTDSAMKKSFGKKYKSNKKNKGKKQLTNLTKHTCWQDRTMFPSNAIHLVAFRQSDSVETASTSTTEGSKPDRSLAVSSNETRKLSAAQGVQKSTGNTAQIAATESTSSESYTDWWRVAYAADRLLFIIYILGTIVVFIIFVCIVASEKINSLVEDPNDSELLLK